MSRIAFQAAPHAVNDGEAHDAAGMTETPPETTTLRSADPAAVRALLAAALAEPAQGVSK